MTSDLEIAQKKLNINAISKETVERVITISNKGAKIIDLQIVLEGIDGSASVSPVSFTLNPWQQKDIVLKINAKEKGLMTGKVKFVFSGETVAESTVAVNIMSENFLFDSAISLSREYRTISAGENIPAQIDLQQVGPQEKVDAALSAIWLLLRHRMPLG